MPLRYFWRKKLLLLNLCDIFFCQNRKISIQSTQKYMRFTKLAVFYPHWHLLVWHLLIQLTHWQTPRTWICRDLNLFCKKVILYIEDVLILGIFYHLYLHLYYKTWLDFTKKVHSETGSHMGNKKVIGFILNY